VRVTNVIRKLDNLPLKLATFELQGIANGHQPKIILSTQNTNVLTIAFLILSPVLPRTNIETPFPEKLKTLYAEIPSTLMIF